MQQPAWFESWFNSPYYHRLYQDRDESEAQAFIQQLTNHLRLKPGARILDLACGKGRHSRSLHELGFDVLGVDIAPESIAYAQQFEEPGLKFAVQDMREPLNAPPFDAVLNLFTSFGYFDSPEEHVAAMHTMAGALKAQGKLVIDYLNVFQVSQQLVAEEQRTIDDTNYVIRRWADAHHFFKEIEVQTAEQPTPLLFREKVAKFSSADFENMFIREGLLLCEAFGDYALRPYQSEESPRLILIAEPIQ